MSVQELRPVHLEGLSALFARLPESDMTFIKEDVSPAALEGWPSAPGWTWVDVADDGGITAMAALLPLSGWSDHVAELRLVVDPATRGRGIGRSLAQHAVAHAIRVGLRKVMVEIPAAQERLAEMFSSVGFTGEALLRDQIRDRDGALQDLLLLAYLADETFDGWDAVGLADAVGGE